MFGCLICRQIPPTRLTRRPVPARLVPVL